MVKRKRKPRGQKGRLPGNKGPECPTHGRAMYRQETRYGGLWICMGKGCDVKCWEGPTSAPGTAEDFEERKATHALIDPEWRNQGGVFDTLCALEGRISSRSRRRRRFYSWFSKVMSKPGRLTHIGMLTAEECRRLRSHFETLRLEVFMEENGLGPDDMEGGPPTVSEAQRM